MPDRQKIRCKNCKKTFYTSQDQMELVDSSPGAEYFKIKCPMCEFENKVNVSDLKNRGKNALYDVGGVIFYTIDFMTFLGMTPTGWFIASITIGAVFVTFARPLYGVPLLILSLAIGIFLYRSWSGRRADPADPSNP